MEGMEVGISGTAVMALAAQLLGGCIKGYEVFIELRDMPTNYEHLRIRLRLEQTRLVNWGEKAGLLTEAFDKTNGTVQLHKNLINEILADIQRLFRECILIERKSEPKQIPELAGDNRSATRLRKDPLITKAMKLWEKMMEYPPRLSWTLVWRDEFEVLVAKLISYNDSLTSLLDRTVITQLYDLQIQSQLMLLQLTSKVDDLHRLAMATQIQSSGTSSTVSIDPRRLLAVELEASEINVPGKSFPVELEANEVSNKTLARLANFKAKQMTLDTNKNAPAGLIEPKQVTLVSSGTIRSLGRYQESNIFVEWKVYDPDQYCASEQANLAQRVHKLANLLAIEGTPPEFRVPKCLGYIHEEQEDMASYGLIYALPSLASGSNCSTLLELYKFAKPSLTLRAQLAHVLSNSLMYLHSVNWLHKSIRSENVLYFTPSKLKPNLTNPLLSGFEYARPDTPEEATEKPFVRFEHELYRHPDGLGQPESRSKKSWDVYSLGVVLVEIAFWKPISNILDIQASQRGAWTKLRKIQQNLLADEFMESLSSEVGQVYASAVRTCIAGGEALGITSGSEESDPEVAADMQQVFSERIVGKLGSIQV